ncbi:hypothetical protein [Pedobacter sp. JCM 36344]|uniref:hypothetical protein n=1 Tax=Pedobacter sp. JCM 36344 TaxID=3374280 RepID=UPI00397E6FDF
MINEYRKSFNENFSDKKFREFQDALTEGFPKIPFRIAETPVFIPKELSEKLIAAGEEIIKLIRQPDFKELTAASVPELWRVPDENDHPHFLTFDFAISKDVNGELTPMLIEMQGFPSLYGFQLHLAKKYKEAFGLDHNLTPLFGDFDEQAYVELLKQVILGDHEPHEVALIDVDALNQKTAIDFLVTQKYIGMKILALTDIFKEGKSLFYLENGEKIRLKRIYNRLIFDEVADKKNIFKDSFDPREQLDIEWVTHPNWFYRVSKYTMPFLKSEFLPETHFLNALPATPKDLENYVLKPLFSFAGMGVLIDVKPADIKAIADPENWILQRKVKYEPVVESPDGGVKVELRLMYLWPDGGEPQLCINLARLSKGKMIGVRYNKDFDWVGGTVGLITR